MCEASVGGAMIDINIGDLIKLILAAVSTVVTVGE